jgi:hypothetical protein
VERECFLATQVSLNHFGRQVILPSHSHPTY